MPWRAFEREAGAKTLAPPKKQGQNHLKKMVLALLLRVLNPDRLTLKLEFVSSKILISIPCRLTILYHTFSYFCAILAAVFVVTIRSSRFISQASVGDVYGESS